MAGGLGGGWQSDGGGGGGTPIVGGGTPTYLAMFVGANTIGDSGVFQSASGNLAIGTTTPEAVAIFQINTTTKGVLLPRMTTAQRNAIVTGASTEGLLIFNTSTRLFSYWDNTAGIWQNIDSQAGGDVSGSGTTNYITKWTDGTNSVIGNSLLFDDGTKVGVGTTSPSTLFQVAGAVTFGVASTTNGSLIYQNSTNAFTVTINSGVTSASYALTLPTAQGAANTVLTNDGAGILSWSSPSSQAWMLNGNTVGSEKFIGTIDNFNFPVRTNNTLNSTFYSNGDVKIGSSATEGIFYDNTNGRVGIRTMTPNSIFVINGSGSNNYPSLRTDVSHDMFLEWNVSGVGKGYLGTHNNDPFVQFNNPLGNTIQTWSSTSENVFFPSTAGVIGMGLSSASAKLHIVGVGNTSATYSLRIDSSTVNNMFVVRDDGNVGIGVSSPSAYLHIKAGTATAGTAPIKLTAGTLLATPELGALEYVDDGTTGHLYFTLKVATVTTRVPII